MSKLIDKLKKLTQSAPAPMGFLTSRKIEKQAPLLILGRIALKATAVAAEGNSGADAVLISAGKSNLTAAGAQKTAKAFGSVPWGVYLEESGEVTGELIKAGGDFVVFSATARITDIPQDEKTGRIVMIESSMDDGLLRAINDMPADAVLVTDALDKSDRLVLHQLMIYRHLSNFIGKPLIVPVAADISESELKALQDAEIDGVMVEADAAKIQKLREKISKLPPRSAKKRDRGDVILPRAKGESQAAMPPDEEEEEE